MELERKNIPCFICFIFFVGFIGFIGILRNIQVKKEVGEDGT